MNLIFKDFRRVWEHIKYVFSLAGIKEYSLIILHLDFTFQWYLLKVNEGEKDTFFLIFSVFFGSYE